MIAQVEEDKRAVQYGVRPGSPFANMEHYTTQLEGEWFRVIPEDYRDVLFLMGLGARSEKFAPAHGNGILISAKSWERYKEGRKQK